MAQQIQIRRGTASEWTTANPVLAEGEQGFETDTLKMKVGDGSTAWTSLDYFVEPAVAGGTGIVESIVAGTNITVDDTDPANPIVSAAGGGGGGGGSTSGFSAYLSGNITTSTGAAIVFNTEEFDPDGMYNSSTGVFTAPSNGWYSFQARIYSQSTLFNNSRVEFRKNGNFWRLGGHTEGVATSTEMNDHTYLTAGETVDVRIGVNAEAIRGGQTYYSCFSGIKHA